MDMSKKTAGETRAPAAIRSFLRGLRILSRFALRMTGRLVIAKVRVSGGHLCEAEVPTEPAGETAARRAAIRTLLSLRGALAPWQSVFLLKPLRKLKL